MLGCIGCPRSRRNARLYAAAPPPLLPTPRRRACHLLRKHALLPFAAPAGLPAFARCAFAFTAHCAALEASHGLQLVPTVQRELWPATEQVGGRPVGACGAACAACARAGGAAL